MTLSYDPLGRRFSTFAGATLYAAYDGQSLIAEYNSASVLQRRFVHGPGVDEPLVWYEGSGTTDRRWFHADERGSVVAVSDASGNLVGSVNRYDEYGVPQGTLTGRFGYTGQVWLPEIGMYDYRARIYNPSLGRFMQTDPIGYGAGMNLYAYVLNDPVNFIDPTGLDQRCVRARGPGTSEGDGNGGVIFTAGWRIVCYDFDAGGSGQPTPGGGGGGPSTPRTPPPQPTSTTCGNIPGHGYFCPNANLSKEDWCAIGREMSRLGEYFPGGAMVAEGVQGRRRSSPRVSRGGQIALVLGGATVVTGRALQDTNCN